MITQVPKEDIHIIWDQVESHIARAVDDTYLPQDILDGIILNKFQLFIPTILYVEDVGFWISLINNLNTNNLAFVSYLAYKKK